MSPNWMADVRMARWMAWVIVPVLALTLWACPKDEPTTQPQEIDVDTTEVQEEPAEEVTERPALDTGDPQEPQLPSDVEELNRYLRERGLVADIYFDFDEAELRPEAIEQLNRNASWLRDNPGYQVLIQGHCDERGTNEYNLSLGERRANTASSYLESVGVDGQRIETISFGEERPVCTESTETCWQRNRRAHFVVQPI